MAKPLLKCRFCSFAQTCSDHGINVAAAQQGARTAPCQATSAATLPWR